MESDDAPGAWTLPSLWTHRTRPQRLGKPHSTRFPTDRMNRLVSSKCVVACAPHNTRALEAQRRRPAVEYGAIDLHKRESQIRIVTADGEVIDRRILSTRERFAAMFCGRARMRILIEASTESEWV